MNDTVAHACLMNKPRFRIGNFERMISAMDIHIVLEIPMELYEIVGEAHLEVSHVATIFLIFHKRSPCGKKIFNCYTVLIVYREFIH